MSDFIWFTENLIQGGFEYAYGISAADITGSGSLDIVAADGNVGLYLFENDGDGNFTRHVIHHRVGEWLERHAIADINGDGKLEIVIVDNINGCLLYFEYENDPRDGSLWRHRYITEGGLPGAYDLTIADLNGDGSLDVAASTYRIGNQFMWFENRGDQWLKHTIEKDISETRTIHAVDFDGDGHVDLLGTAHKGNEVVWYRNPGDPTREPWEKHVIDTSPGPFHGYPVDMDGDGDMDVVMALSPHHQHPLHGKGLDQIVWYENEDTSEFGPWKKHVIAEAFPNAFEVIAGDIDGDGQIEVVATGWFEKGRLVVFKHDGDPRGSWRMQGLKEGWLNSNQVILADLNGDGKLDIVACAEVGSNELRWWRNEGSV